MFMRLDDKPDDYGQPFWEVAKNFFLGVLIAEVWFAVVLAIVSRVR
jgi:hypothetical protein